MQMYFMHITENRSLCRHNSLTVHLCEVMCFKQSINSKTQILTSNSRRDENSFFELNTKLSVENSLFCHYIESLLAKLI